MIGLTEFDYSVDNRTATSKYVMDVVSDIITLKFKDPLLASKYLPVLAKYYLFTRDKKVVKSIFYICDNFNSENHTKSVARYVKYALFVVYYAMPFYPKAIEYGLQLESEGFEYPFMELNTYKYLANMCISLKLYNEAIKYNKKYFDAARRFFEVGSADYCKKEIIYYNQVLLINTYSNNYFGASIALEKTRDCVNGYPFIEKKKQFENYIAFTIFSYYMGFKSSFSIKSYIDSMYEMIEKPEIYTPLEFTVDLHVPFLKILRENGIIDKALEFCTYILSSPYFVGDRAPIYNELFALYEQLMVNADSKDLKVLLKKYRSIVAEYTQAKADMSIILASEEFKLHNIRSNINQIQSQYKKDHLTGCLNRYSLEEDWKAILKKYSEFSLVFFDLDNLKYVNDTLGHEAGDIYIKKFVNDIRETLSSKDYFYRYGGDEFILITRKDKDFIRDSLVEIRDKAELSAKSLFTFGISSYPKDAKTLQELINIADERMYQAKKKNKR